MRIFGGFDTNKVKISYINDNNKELLHEYINVINDTDIILSLDTSPDDNQNKIKIEENKIVIIGEKSETAVFSNVNSNDNNIYTEINNNHVIVKSDNSEDSDTIFKITRNEDNDNNICTEINNNNVIVKSDNGEFKITKDEVIVQYNNDNIEYNDGDSEGDSIIKNTIFKITKDEILMQVGECGIKITSKGIDVFPFDEQEIKEI